MAYHEQLADRTRELITVTHKKVEEKKMFGGLCFMVNGKMCVGVEKGRMMVRFDPEKEDEVLQQEGARPMNFTGKVMRGYAFVDASALKTKKTVTVLGHPRAGVQQEGESFKETGQAQQVMHAYT
jgi:TfoX/Sxy family transcriptional regulator of competence genes